VDSPVGIEVNTVQYKFLFVIQQNNFYGVCVDFSLIGYDIEVFFLMAGITISIADEGKGV